MDNATKQEGGAYFRVVIADANDRQVEEIHHHGSFASALEAGRSKLQECFQRPEEYAAHDLVDGLNIDITYSELHLPSEV